MREVIESIKRYADVAGRACGVTASARHDIDIDDDYGGDDE